MGCSHRHEQALRPPAPLSPLHHPAHWPGYHYCCRHHRHRHRHHHQNPRLALSGPACLQVFFPSENLDVKYRGLYVRLVGALLGGVGRAGGGAGAGG